MALPPYPKNEDIILLGNARFNWAFSPAAGYDLTHPSSSGHTRSFPRLWMKTSTDPIIINPHKTALIAVDLQNYFLSKALGHHQSGLHVAEETLREVAFPAARDAGIQIVHLTWGFTEEEVKIAPPAVLRMFSGAFGGGDGGRGCRRSTCSHKAHGDPAAMRQHATIGDEIGPLKLWNKQIILGGRRLVRDTWNAELYEATRRDFAASQEGPLPDARFHKTRASGFWAGSSSSPSAPSSTLYPGGIPDVVRFLRARGVTTLLFGGAGTETGVWASAQDASNWGFDVVLLSDGCGSTAGTEAVRFVEERCAEDLGFVSTCEDFSRGVASMLTGM